MSRSSKLWYGPSPKIFSDNDCENINNYTTTDLLYCQGRCKNTNGCTAINFSQGENGCSLRKCQNNKQPSMVSNDKPYKSYGYAMYNLEDEMKPTIFVGLNTMNVHVGFGGITGRAPFKVEFKDSSRILLGESYQIELGKLVQKASASISGSQPEVTKEEVQRIKDWTKDNGVKWLWDFNDGTTSTEQDPVHTFTKPGIYNVTLTITYNGLSEIGTLHTPIIVSQSTKSMSEVEEEKVKKESKIEQRYVGEREETKRLYELPYVEDEQEIDQEPISEMIIPPLMVEYEQEIDLQPVVVVEEEVVEEEVEEEVEGEEDRYIRLKQLIPTFEIKVDQEKPYKIQFIDTTDTTDIGNIDVNRHWVFFNADNGNVLSKSSEPKPIKVFKSGNFVAQLYYWKKGRRNIIINSKLTRKEFTVSLTSEQEKELFQKYKKKLRPTIGIKKNQGNVLVIRLIDTTNPEGVASTWIWQIGRLGKDTTDFYTIENSPTIKVPEPGIYWIYLEVTNNLIYPIDGTFKTNEIVVIGNPTKEQQIEQLQKMVPEITTQYRDNLQVYFGTKPSFFANLSQIGNQTKFYWDFGDGSPNSVEQSPTHSYKEPGNYKVSLMITDPRIGKIRQSLGLEPRIIVSKEITVEEKTVDTQSTINNTDKDLSTGARIGIMFGSIIGLILIIAIIYFIISRFTR